MRVSQEFESRQYPSEENAAEDSPGFRVETNLTLDSDSRSFDIDTYEYHASEGSHNVSFGTDFIFSDWSDLQAVADLLQQQIRQQDERTRSITVTVDSGTAYNSRLGQWVEELEEVQFTVDDRELQVDAQGLRGRLLHYEEMIDYEMQDRRNAMGFLDMISELFEDAEEEPVLHLQHPDLRSDAVPEYADGHYQSSVRTAFRVLEERIRDEGGFSQDSVGMGMAQDAFSPDDGPLTFAEVEAEQRGWMYLYAGGFGALRNPPSHRNEDRIDQQRAMQILHYVDLLLDVLETEVAQDDV